MDDVLRKPELQGDTIHFLYTKNGKKEMEIKARRMLSYDKPDLKQDEFPMGILVYAYDDSGRMSTMLDADYAIYQREKKLWEVRHNVIAVNEKGDSISTERLFWDDENQKIYTNDNVRIKTKEATLFGKGFESDIRFNDWVILRPTGTIAIFTADTLANGGSDIQ